MRSWTFDVSLNIFLYFGSRRFQRLTQVRFKIVKHWKRQRESKFCILWTVNDTFLCLFLKITPDKVNVDSQCGVFVSGPLLDHDVPYDVFSEKMRELD